MLLILVSEYYVSEVNKLIIAVASPKKTTVFGIKDCFDGLFFVGLKKLISNVNFSISSPPFYYVVCILLLLYSIYFIS